ncbi:MAG: hypothetical protein J7K26_01680 [Candidatus Aenigmarchaeota archaeon]|nr:hypothetical protein [Candidatus Aenigmarchaeota archaeon]
MIFVTTGTFAGFDTLMKKLDELVSKKIIKEKIIAQIGNGNYKPKKFKWFRFSKTLLPYYRKADLIISHEGAGTLFEIITMNKKLIALENPETIHNPDLIKKLSNKKYLLWCKNINNLEKCIKLSKKYNFKKYKNPPCRIQNEINKYLDFFKS